MRITLKKIIILVLSIYFVVTCYTGYKLLQRRINKYSIDTDTTKNTDNDDNWNPWGEEFEHKWHKPRISPLDLPFQPQEDEEDLEGQEIQEDLSINPGDHVIEIWGKAAIGNYLWEHIIRGRLEKKLGGIWSYGEKKIDNFVFRFRTGPGVVPAKVPQDVTDLVIVLNGREDSKIEFSTVWLNYIKNLPDLKNVAMVLLGNEMCDNSWIESFMTQHGGFVKAAFLVYDTKEVDNEHIFQWPLGVATYRGFPKVPHHDLSVTVPRRYLCNFLGTVYSGSSREVLIKAIHDNQLNKWCYVNPRYDWLPGETQESREEYYGALLRSDFTLNPVGMNTECYRIYEAMSYGSIPIVEDRMTPGECGNNSVYQNAPLRLIKKYGAPVVYIKSWKELPDLLAKYKDLPLKDIIEWRTKVIDWYDKFKNHIRDYFVETLQRKFQFEGDIQNDGHKKVDIL